MPGSKLSHLWICSCLICDQPLPSREGRHTFKYFLMAGPGRPRIVWRARDTVPQLPEWRAKSDLKGGGKRMLRCRLLERAANVIGSMSCRPPVSSLAGTVVRFP